MKNKSLLIIFFFCSFIISCQKDISDITNMEEPMNELKLKSTSSVYWNKAQNVHNFIVGNLLTSYNSYRNNPGGGTTCYEWPQSSQIYADAAFVRYGDTRYNSYMNNTYNWLGNMWDTGSPVGGYFSSANINGSGAGGDKYLDDNSLTGVIYLDCYDVTTGTQKTAYLNSAMAVANYLMNSGLWDNTFGGGFWWNSGTQERLKPTQTNGLALQLFLRLYNITGQTYYRDWAISIRTWLESYMYDSSDGLYNWQYTSDGVLHHEKFAYDNAIMIEAFLLYASVMNNASYNTKAQTLGVKLNQKLWDNTYHVYKFNSSDPRINPAWCGWASQAMIKLYQLDGNTAWLDYAQQNIDAINSKLQDTGNYGYYNFCNLDGSGKYTNMEGVDQAWMQRVQVLMSNYR